MRWAHRRGRGTPADAAVDGRRDQGTAGAEVLPFSVLIFVFGTLLLVNAWGVIDAKFAVSSAAREAARTYAEGDGGLRGEALADAAAREAVVAYGRTGSRLQLEGPRGALVRCGEISYTASYPVPAVRIPVIGGFGRAFDVTAQHTTRVDRLRAGLDAESAC